MKFKNTGVGNQTFITFPSNIGHPEDTPYLTLHRFITDALTGTQTDFPVSLITVNDGSTSRYTSFDYNFTTATMDPSGTVAQYHEVTVIPGSATASSKPYGSTKTFFYNGLTSSELGAGTYFPVDLRWSGAPYASKVYNSSSNQEVSSSNTTYSNFSKEIKNGDNTKVEAGFYVRPTEARSMVDGIETVTTQSYDATTGLLAQSRSYDYDSKRGNNLLGTNYTQTTYKYFWEQYDANREKNILSPVIQTKQSVFNNGGETIVGVSAVTWKSWNGTFAPHKTYGWKRTGTADFDFTNWSGTGEPPADWIKASQIEDIDAKGNVLQVYSR